MRHWQSLTCWSELEPLDDEAVQRTIELLARLGRRTEGIRAFELFEERLQREELEPMPELRNMMAEIRAGTLGPAAKAPDPISAPVNQDELLAQFAGGLRGCAFARRRSKRARVSGPRKTAGTLRRH